MSSFNLGKFLRLVRGLIRMFVYRSSLRECLLVIISDLMETNHLDFDEVYITTLSVKIILRIETVERVKISLTF